MPDNLLHTRILVSGVLDSFWAHLFEAIQKPPLLERKLLVRMDHTTKQPCGLESIEENSSQGKPSLVVWPETIALKAMLTRVNNPDVIEQDNNLKS